MAIEQQITIAFRYGKKNLSDLHQLSKDLNQILDRGELGEVDGHEISSDLSHGFLYLYGSSAEAMFKTIEEVLRRTDFMKGATATLKFKDGTDDYPQFDIAI